MDRKASSIQEFNGSVHSVAETMLSFLTSLAYPVIPYELQRECILACSNYEATLSAISKLSDVHLNTFIYLMKFLREVVDNREKNQCSLEHLCKFFLKKIHSH